MSHQLMGRKKGMTQLFDESGFVVPCTVIEVEKNVVVQVKTEEKDGYSALQMGCETVKTKDPRTVERRVSKPLRGHFKKAGIAPMKKLAEFRVTDTKGYEVGQQLGLELFEKMHFVDVTAVSKGKGFQGVMKRHNYHGGPASHGSKFHRRRGSQGMRSTPGRCFPGGKRPGHMGMERVTTQNLRVIHVDPEAGLIIVKGAVPGPVDGLVTISEAIKKKNQAG